ncbi:MAG: response regulator [Chitinophagales bacterium]|nr:response regulator [Chitinophagales bacterium]
MKIGVVEDEIIIADNICNTLLKLGYSVAGPVISFSDAIDMIEAQKPDLLLLDIQLAGSSDGIELAAYVRENYTTPFIFLTANSDKATIDRAKEVLPYAFLVKPFTPDEIFAAIEIAMTNFAARQTTAEHPKTPEPFIFVKHDQAFHKLFVKDIVYAQSVENYVTILAADKRRFIVRTTFQQFLQQFTEQQLFRLHRSYAVNPAFIENLDAASVIVGGQIIPMHKGERERLMELLKLK